MCIELVGQEDDLILLGVLGDGLLDEQQEIFFLSCGVYPVVYHLSFSHLQGSHQTSGAFAAVLLFDPARLAFSHGMSLMEAFQGLDTAFFLYTDQVKAILKPERFDNKRTNEGHKRHKGWPVADLGKEPIAVLVRL